LAKALLAIHQKVKVFLLGDAVALAKKGQQTPAGYYNLAQMVADLIMILGSMTYSTKGKILSTRQCPGKSEREISHGSSFNKKEVFLGT